MLLHDQPVYLLATCIWETCVATASHSPLWRRETSPTETCTYTNKNFLSLSVSSVCAYCKQFGRVKGPQPHIPPCSSASSHLLLFPLMKTPPLFTCLSFFMVLRYYECCLSWEGKEGEKGEEGGGGKDRQQKQGRKCTKVTSLKAWNCTVM